MPCPFCKKEHNWSVKEALARLEGGPKEIRAALAGAGKEEIDWSPGPRAWSPRQVAFHLLDTEVVFSMRYRKILAEDDGVLPAFDQERWADALTPGRDLANALDTFEQLRRDNVALLRAAASAEKMERSGRHPEYGVLTLRDHVLHLSLHDVNHAGQIRRTREQYKGR